MGKQKAARVIVTGRVQGVCFRMETRKAAMRLNVRGWVKNRPDGAVEGFFEGAETDVNGLVDWCRKGPAMARVLEVAVRDVDPTGEFPDFSIRYE